MRISAMPESEFLNGFEQVPIYDPQQQDPTQQNRRISVNLLTGIQGPRGFQGLSAYDLWISVGNTGTVQEFLASLVGSNGSNGTSGTDGQSAYQLWESAGNTGTLADFLASLVGQSAYQVWESAGNTGTVDDFLASLQGPQGLSPYELWEQAGHTGSIDDYLTYITGQSAYQVWESAGNTGTVQEFLASLVGPPGAIGPSGPTGNTGLPGSRWYNGDGAPSPTLGVNNDYYLRLDTGDVLNKVSNVWSGAIINLIGPQGPTGATGATGSGTPGSVIYNGDGYPNTDIGITGDYYIDLTSGNLYQKASNDTWGDPIANIIGPQGPTGATGTGTPGAGVPTGGAAGAGLYKTSTADYATAWITPPGLYMFTEEVLVTWPSSGGQITGNVWIPVNLSSLMSFLPSDMVVSYVLAKVRLNTGQGPDGVYARANLTGTNPQVTLLEVGAYSTNDSTEVTTLCLIPLHNNGCQIYVSTSNSGGATTSDFGMTFCGVLTTSTVSPGVSSLDLSSEVGIDANTGGPGSISQSAPVGQAGTSGPSTVLSPV